jgi:hypothetical protein
MSDRSKVNGQMKCNPWFSRLGLGLGLTTPPQKNLLLGNQDGGQDPHRLVAPVENKQKKKKTSYNSCISCNKGIQMHEFIIIIGFV